MAHRRGDSIQGRRFEKGLQNGCCGAPRDAKSENIEPRTLKGVRENEREQEGAFRFSVILERHSELQVTRFQQRCDQRQRQSHHIEVAALDARNPARRAALNGVGAGLVHGLAGGHVGRDLLVRQRQESEPPLPRRPLRRPRRSPGHAGNHAVRSAGKQAQHPRRVGRVFRLAQNLVVERDRCIGAQHHQRDWPSDLSCFAPIRRSARERQPRPFRVPAA